MKLLRCLSLLSCLGLLRGETRGLQGSHSLRYSFSFLSEPLPGVPQYSVVGYVDDVPIIGYTSESRRAGPRAPWMQKITDEEPLFWEDSTEILQEVQKTLNDRLRNLMEQNNQAVGLHMFQAMQGCELREDGSVKGFERFAYDGSNYTANLNRATDTQDLGNSEEVECIQHLKKLLKFGQESLLRTVAPQTKLSERKSGDHTFLIGYAYGFYPREIEVKWVRNGTEIPWESREILPNPDGTYQVRTTVEVQEGDDVKTYEFHVNHSSLPETVIVTVAYDPAGEGGKHSALRVVVVVVVTVLVVVLATAVVTLPKHQHKRKRSSEAQPPGESNNKEELEMMYRQRDAAGPSTGSDV